MSQSSRPPRPPVPPAPDFGSLPLERIVEAVRVDAASDEPSTPPSDPPTDEIRTSDPGGFVFPDSPAFLRAILENVAHPIFVKDREHRLVLVNRAFVALTGRVRRDILGKNDFELFPPKEAAFFRAMDEEAFRTRNPVVIEEEPLTDAEGKRHLLRTVKVPITDPESTALTYIVGIITEITHMREAEDALRLANEELERRVEERTRALHDAQHALLRKERLAVLGQLAGGLAHQIRNPLAAITTATGVLRRKLGEAVDADTRQALSAIREEVWEANRIITDLLDYARVKPPSRTVVTLAELIASALEHSPPPDRIHIVQEVDDIELKVDDRQVRDALGNVIRNAYEAMPRGGTLTIQATAEPGLAMISVEDSGPGLTRDSMKSLFEPLVTSKPLGLGLGLSTARSLIENQGGTIRAATQRGRGARFEIRIPYDDTET